MKLDLANLQAEIVDTLQTVMGIEKISLFLFDKEKGCYVRKASRGLNDTQASPIRLIQRTFSSLPLGVQSADRHRRTPATIRQDSMSDWPLHSSRP